MSKSLKESIHGVFQSIRERTKLDTKELKPNTITSFFKSLLSSIKKTIGLDSDKKPKGLKDLDTEKTPKKTSESLKESIYGTFRSVYDSIKRIFGFKDTPDIKDKMEKTNFTDALRLFTNRIQYLNTNLSPSSFKIPKISEAIDKTIGSKELGKKKDELAGLTFAKGTEISSITKSGVKKRRFWIPSFEGEAFPELATFRSKGFPTPPKQEKIFGQIQTYMKQRELINEFTKITGRIQHMVPENVKEKLGAELIRIKGETAKIKKVYGTGEEALYRRSFLETSEALIQSLIGREPDLFKKVPYNTSEFQEHLKHQLALKEKGEEIIPFEPAIYQEPPRRPKIIPRYPGEEKGKTFIFNISITADTITDVQLIDTIRSEVMKALEEQVRII